MISCTLTQTFLTIQIESLGESMPEQQTAVGSTKSLRFFTSSHAFSETFFTTYVVKNLYYFKKINITLAPAEPHVLIPFCICVTKAAGGVVDQIFYVKNGRIKLTRKFLKKF